MHIQTCVRAYIACIHTHAHSHALFWMNCMKTYMHVCSYVPTYTYAYTATLCSG